MKNSPLRRLIFVIAVFSFPKTTYTVQLREPLAGLALTLLGSVLDKTSSNLVNKLDVLTFPNITTNTKDTEKTKRYGNLSPRRALTIPTKEIIKLFHISVAKELLSPNLAKTFELSTQTTKITKASKSLKIVIDGLKPQEALLSAIESDQVYFETIKQFAKRILPTTFSFTLSVLNTWGAKLIVTYTGEWIKNVLSTNLPVNLVFLLGILPHHISATIPIGFSILIWDLSRYYIIMPILDGTLKHLPIPEDIQLLALNEAYGLGPDIFVTLTFLGDAWKNPNWQTAALPSTLILIYCVERQAFPEMANDYDLISAITLFQPMLLQILRNKGSLFIIMLTFASALIILDIFQEGI